jgi:AcrR family transcriptional regulator
MAEPTQRPLAGRPESRGERKERTRRAILDAALALSGETSLVALSLRQVAKEVGIVPTAFYRHFDSIEALGMALVDESFVSLRAMLRDIRRGDPAFSDVVDGSITILVDHVHQQRSHFLFIARERAAGPPAVRDAIHQEIELCERELATDLARLPATAPWSAEDLRILSNLIVMAMVATAESIMNAPPRPDAEKQIIETARAQLRMVLVGALNWQSRT